MKLHHHAHTRSCRVRWLLEELGVPYELEVVDVFAGRGRDPAYRAIHPHGYVPALTLDDGRVILESAGICLYLADLHAEKGLAPALGAPERAPYCQWMTYVPATCDPPLETVIMHTRFLPEAKRVPALVERARKTWSICERTIGDGLGDKPFLLGDRFTAADVMVGSALAWARFVGVFGSEPRLEAYAARLAERPAFGVAYG